MASTSRLERLHLRRALLIARGEPVPIELPPPDIGRTAARAQQAILWHALRTGEVKQVRRAGRMLRVRDFATRSAVVEPLLGVLRDARSDEGEILEAAARLAALRPAGF